MNEINIILNTCGYLRDDKFDRIERYFSTYIMFLSFS
jgi:hypothetical protein